MYVVGKCGGGSVGGWCGAVWWLAVFFYCVFVVLADKELSRVVKIERFVMRRKEEIEAG